MENTAIKNDYAIVAMLVIILLFSIFVPIAINELSDRIKEQNAAHEVPAVRVEQWSMDTVWTGGWNRY